MVRSELRKCSIVICFFMMCPRRTNFARTPKIQILQPTVPDIPQFEQSEPKPYVSIESIITEPIKPEKETKTEKSKDEPGFDLTEEEIAKFNIWPQGVIPYYIDVHSYSDKVLRDRIRGFLNTVSSTTSLNFLEMPNPPKDDDSRWVFFINRRGLLGCADHSTKNFTNKGVQKVILGYDCMSTGAELGESVLAIAGVPPQHNSPDRDKYIHVVDQNIKADKKNLFTKLNNNEWLFHDIEYDFASASHYHSHRYSVNGKATIEIKEKYQDNPIGESKGLSTKDILKIKMLYNFISKKKQNITDCHKLFEPGSHFNRYRPSKTGVSPRKKPNKYTGLSNDIDEDSVKAPVGVGQMAGIDELPQIEDEPKSVKDENQQLNLNSDESGEQSNIAKKPESLNHYQLSLKRDPISYLSDYKSSDEGRQKLSLKLYKSPQKLSFAKPGQHIKPGKKIRRRHRE